jgi:gamma-glutamyltranspeptidase/glutathione hydrolase
VITEGLTNSRAAVGRPPVCKNRFYGADDPRRNSGLALGYLTRIWQL